MQQEGQKHLTVSKVICLLFFLMAKEMEGGLEMPKGLTYLDTAPSELELGPCPAC